MNKLFKIAAVGLGASIIVGLVILGVRRSEEDVSAQVTSGPIPTPSPYVKQSSPDDEFLMLKVAEIAENIEAEIRRSEPKWMLTKKSPSFGNSRLPDEKGGGALKQSSFSLQFKRGKTEAYINFRIAEPSTVEEVAEAFKMRLERRARGITKNADGIGDEAVISMDDPQAPSTAARLYFRKGRFTADVDITDQARKREQNEEDAIRLGKIIEPLIR